MEKKTPAHGRIYTVTSETGCTVTDTATGKLLQTCPPGVQTSFAAVGPAVIISDDSALFAGPFDLAPGGLPANGGLTPEEKGKLLTTDGERLNILPAGSPTLPMTHAAWYQVDETPAAVSIAPAQNDGTRSLTMHLLLTPAADMPAGWLTSADPALPVYWHYGEPMLVRGYRYAVTLVQLPHAIIANMTPLGLNPAA